MDDDLHLDGLGALDDATPPAFDDAGAASALAASRRRQARVMGGAAMAGVLSVLLAIAVLRPGAAERPTALTQASPPTVPGIPGATEGPGSTTTLHVPELTVPPSLPDVVRLPTTIPGAPSTTSKPPPPTGPTSSTTPRPTGEGLPPQGQVAPREGIEFELLVRSTTLRWDEVQEAAARITNHSNEDLFILTGCGVTYADLYDAKGVAVNDRSRTKERCDEKTGYFGPGVVHPGETRMAAVQVVAQGPNSPEAAPGSPGVRPGSYQAYASWALDSRQAGRIDYMYSKVVMVEVVGR